VTTKSGPTNGTAAASIWPLPLASAESDRTTFSANAERRNMYGGTLGNPISRTSCLLFSMEYWKIQIQTSGLRPCNYAEKQGDFTQSHYLSGGVTAFARSTTRTPW